MTRAVRQKTPAPWSSWALRDCSQATSTDRIESLLIFCNTVTGGTIADSPNASEHSAGLDEAGQSKHLSVVHERPQNLCGITGFTSKNWEPPPDRIRAATSTLIHRGPDQTGVFESQLFSMGATRLKIIDLHGGDQPILSDDGDTGIVFNGEIYNHLELRTRTRGARAPFHIALRYRNRSARLSRMG